MEWAPDIRVGYRSGATIWICPSIHPNRLPFEETLSHFFYGPQGETTIGCPGEDRCLFCMARNALHYSGRAEDVERARKLGRARKGQLYQVLYLERPDLHMVEGKMVPMKFRAGATVQQGLMTIFNRYGVANVLNPNGGRAIFIEKIKRGPQKKEIDWTSPMPSDPVALPQQFWPALHNLIDLSKLFPPATREVQAEAVKALNLPWTEQMTALWHSLPAGTPQLPAPGTAPAAVAPQPPQPQSNPWAQPQTPPNPGAWGPGTAPGGPPQNPNPWGPAPGPAPANPNNPPFAQAAGALAGYPPR